MESATAKERKNERKRIQRALAKEKGLCITCCKERPSTQGVMSCTICLTKRAKRKHNVKPSAVTDVAVTHHPMEQRTDDARDELAAPVTPTATVNINDDGQSEPEVTFLGDLDSVPLRIENQSKRMRYSQVTVTQELRNIASGKQCSICLDELLQVDTDIALTLCGHLFHVNCIKNAQNNGCIACPECRATTNQLRQRQTSLLDDKLHGAATGSTRQQGTSEVQQGNQLDFLLAQVLRGDHRVTRSGTSRSTAALHVSLV
eukprot:GILJ01002422.1.p1 GENE.GILJ01002422.1~~GILJ01002422.1.p1  ORF type:complete len:260 (-),score=24.67 GILJ01002422.1:41-820(-)